MTMRTSGPRGPVAGADGGQVTSALSRLHLERCSGVVTLRGESGVLLVGLCKGSVISVCGPSGPADLGLLLDALDSPAVTFEFCSEDSDDDPAEGTELGVVLMHHARRRAGGTPPAS